MSTDGSYQIFRKERDNTTVLVEAVKGLDEADKRVRELNETEQMEHFVFDPIKGEVIEPSHPWVAKDPFAP